MFLLTLLSNFLADIYIKRKMIDSMKEILVEKSVRISKEIEHMKDSQKIEKLIEIIIEEERLSENGHFFAVNKDNEIIAYPSYDKSKYPELYLFQTGNIRKIDDSAISEVKYRYVSENNKKSYLFYKKLNDEYTVFLYLPLAEVFSSYSAFQLKLWGIFTIIALVVMIAYYLFSMTLGTPLYSMVNFTNNIIDPDKNPEIDLDINGEWGVLATNLYHIKKILNNERHKQLNTITNLPGNNELQIQLYNLIDSNKNFSVGLVDAKNFDAYNNKYGFNKGDSVISLIARIIRKTLLEIEPKETALYHMGKDTLLFVCGVENIEEICKKIISEFDEQISDFYDPEDLKKGCIELKDRQGNFQQYPILTLAIGVATNAQRPLIHPLQIVHITKEIINYLKNFSSKSSYMIDRRKASDEERQNFEEGAGQKKTSD